MAFSVSGPGCPSPRNRRSPAARFGPLQNAECCVASDSAAIHMNFSHFFIRRPIFAGVLSIVIFLVGLIALFRLPISEYPEVVPPTVVVRAVYPGANPKTIAETVASPLEQSVNGVEDSLYMFSQATPDGVMTLTVT